MKKPVTPKEMEKIKIPDEVISAFNDLIKENWNGGESYVRQKDAVARAVSNFQKAGKKISTDAIFEKGWLDVEKFYRKAGWKVTYDKPAYNEDYEASFTFGK